MRLTKINLALGWHVAVAVVGLALTVTNLSAATIIVDTTLGGLLEDLAGNETCEFEEAVRAAWLDIPVDACPPGETSDVIDLQSLEGEIDVQGNSAISVFLSIGGDNQTTQVIGPGAEKLRIQRATLAVEGDSVVSISGLTWTDTHAHTNGAIQMSFGPELAIRSVRVINNSGFNGGAISVWGGALEVVDSEISDNNSINDGGAVRAGPDSTVLIKNSTISSNSTLGWAGGIHCMRCDLTIENSTITHNTARHPFGAGIHIEDFNGPSNTTIRNSVVADNRIVDFDGEILGRSDFGAFTNGFGHFGTIAHSIIDVIEFLDTRKYVILDSLLDDNVDLHRINIQPLCFNGGSTRSHVLGRGSIAHDFGEPSFSGLEFDQRGVGYPRVLNGRIDAGAVEFNFDSIFVGGFENLSEPELCNLGM